MHRPHCHYKLHLAPSLLLIIVITFLTWLFGFLRYLDHGLYCHLFLDVVAVEEQVILQFFAQTEHPDVVWLYRYSVELVSLVTCLTEQLLQLQDC